MPGPGFHRQSPRPRGRRRFVALLGRVLRPGEGFGDADLPSDFARPGDFAAPFLAPGFAGSFACKAITRFHSGRGSGPVLRRCLFRFF